MKMDVGLQLRMGQQLIMTPQLQQAIKLLQLSRYELEQLVDQSLIENPALEIAEDQGDLENSQNEGEISESLENITNPADNESTESYEQEWQDYVESGMGTIAERKGNDTDQEHGSILESCAMPTTSINEHLLWQIDVSDFSEEEQEISRYIVGNLDEDGYLATSLRNLLATSQPIYELIKQLIVDLPFEQQDPLENHMYDVFHQERKLILNPKELPKKKKIPIFEEEEEEKNSEFWIAPQEISDQYCFLLEKILKKVQTLDPPGVGARNLSECLLLQLPLKPENTLVRKIIQHEMSLLMQKDLHRIAKNQKSSLEDIVQAYEMITVLEPKPGRPFSNEVTQYIIPDVYIYRKNNDYAIRLNQESLPKIRISQQYREISDKLTEEAQIKKTEQKSSGEKEEEEDLTGQYLVQKIKAAEWLMKSIDQRQKTIYKVTESILKHQRDFFKKGPDSMKPMILKVVADDIDVHESTVSRITTNKFVHTPQGIFELKYFFSSGIAQDGGDIISSQKIKDQIHRMIREEDPKKPLTDNQIAAVLEKTENIQVARRTVAKYREALNILSSNKRKRLF